MPETMPVFDPLAMSAIHPDCRRGSGENHGYPIVPSTREAPVLKDF
jgi:hypothetical protein